jgi:hypothetical protein
MNNIIYLEFNDKSHFPPGKWLQEPDFCKWTSFGLACVAFRDMSWGIWRGWAGIPENHILYKKTMDKILDYEQSVDLFYSVHGGISVTGSLPYKYHKHNNNLWWIGIETCHGTDLMPLVNVNSKLQTYKDFSFIRTETKKLAYYLSKIKE